MTDPHFPKIINISTDPTTKETYVKAFLINDEINKNFWKVPNDVLKKYASSFIGRPLIKHASGDHPPYSKEGIDEGSPTFVQDIMRHDLNYKIGEIVDVKYEQFSDNPDKEAWFAYIRMNNSPEIDNIKSGAASFYVSPQIFDLNPPVAGEPTKDFIPLHLAIVNEPAYGDIARIKGVCNGEGKPCINALKKAATELINQIEKQRNYIDSSLVEKTVNKPINLVNNNNNAQQQQLDPNYPVINQLANSVEQQQQVTQSQPPQTTQKKQLQQEIDSNGNVITKTEEIKSPAKKQQQVTTPEINNNTSIPQQQQNTTLPQEVVNTTAPVNVETPQIPQELVEKLKEFDKLKERLDSIESFKKTSEEKALLEASEQQRQTIDAAFGELFPDQAQRSQVVDFFVQLNIPDDALNTLLDFVTKGVFKTGADASQNTQQAGTTPTKKKVKGAAVVLTAANNNNGNSSYLNNGVSYSSKFQNGFLGDVNIDNLL